MEHEKLTQVSQQSVYRWPIGVIDASLLPIVILYYLSNSQCTL